MAKRKHKHLRALKKREKRETEELKAAALRLDDLLGRLRFSHDTDFLFQGEIRVGDVRLLANVLSGALHRREREESGAEVAA